MKFIFLTTELPHSNMEVHQFLPLEHHPEIRPHPWGVPVKTKSPSRSVKKALRSEIISYRKNHVAVLACCFIFPLTERLMFSSKGRIDEPIFSTDKRSHRGRLLKSLDNSHIGFITKFPLNIPSCEIYAYPNPETNSNAFLSVPLTHSS